MNGFPEKRREPFNKPENVLEPVEARSALEQEITGYHREIFNFFLSKLRQSRVPDSKASAEDLTQTTMLKALKNMHTFASGKSGVKTWLFTIANNTLIDLYRAGGRNPTVEINDDNEHSISNAHASTKTASQQEEKATAGLYAEELLSFLKDPDDIKIARLRFVDGLDYNSIVQETGFSINTVKSRLYRIKETIKSSTHIRVRKRGAAS